MPVEKVDQPNQHETEFSQKNTKKKKTNQPKTVYPTRTRPKVVRLYDHDDQRNVLNDWEARCTSNI